MTGLVGNITTTTEFQPIPFRKGAYKNELSIVFCNPTGTDNYIYIRWRRDAQQVYLYYNYPVLAYDTYPRDQTPFRITINLGDALETKSLNPGIDVSLVS